MEGAANVVEQAHNDIKKRKYSPKAQDEISHKMDLMKNEDRPQKQKVAIAISEARQKGLKVPSPKK